MATGTIILHQYYFAEHTGNLLGVLPKSSTVIKISGPFISFDKSKRLLKSKDTIIHLPEGYAETSKNPPLYQNTLEVLKKLSI